MSKNLKAGDPVVVKWARLGWLPGSFEYEQNGPAPGEKFNRIKVKMDNGLACEGYGYHPSCVKKVI